MNKTQKFNSMIAQNISARGDKGEGSVNVLIDTGASHSFILRSIAEKIGSIIKLPEKIVFSIADKSDMSIVDGIILLIDMAGQKIIDTFLVVDETVADVILGESTMRKYGLKIDLEKNTIYASIKETNSLPKQKDINLIISGKDNHMEELLERVRYFLALPLTATAEDMVTELTKLAAQLKTAVGSTATAFTAPILLTEINNLKTSIINALAIKNEIFTILELKPEATVEEAKGLIVAAKGAATSAGDTAQKLAVLEAQINDDKFNAVIAKGSTAGRITPAQKDNADWMKVNREWAKNNFATFEEYFTAKAPQIIPVNKITVGGGIAAAASEVTEEDKIVAKQLGIDPEKLKV